MQSVLISINPKWCEKIASREKRIEVRKTRPKIDGAFKVYIYQTKGKWIYKLLSWLNLCQGKVIGEFVCDEIKNIFANSRFWGFEEIEKQSCLMGDEIRKYANGKENCYAWHISDLKIYDKPKELGEFKKPIMPTGLEYENNKITRPPQSWQYINDLAPQKFIDSLEGK